MQLTRSGQLSDVGCSYMQHIDGAFRAQHQDLDPALFAAKHAGTVEHAERGSLSGINLDPGSVGHCSFCLCVAMIRPGFSHRVGLAGGILSQDILKCLKNQPEIF